MRIPALISALLMLATYAHADSPLTMELQEEQAYLSERVRNPFYGRSVEISELRDPRRGSYCKVGMGVRDCGYRAKEYCKLAISDIREPNAFCEAQ